MWQKKVMKMIVTLNLGLHRRPQNKIAAIGRCRSLGIEANEGPWAYRYSTVDVPTTADIRKMITMSTYLLVAKQVTTSKEKKRSDRNKHFWPILVLKYIYS